MGMCEGRMGGSTGVLGMITAMLPADQVSALWCEVHHLYTLYM